MALQPCRECEKEISSEAKACPHCGAPITKEKRFGFGKALAWAAAALIIFTFTYLPYRGGQEQQLMRQALSVTTTGMTEGQIEELAASLKSEGTSVLENRELLYWMVCSGRFDSDSMPTHSRTAARLMAVTGKGPKEGATFILRNIMGEKSEDPFIACADW